MWPSDESIGVRSISSSEINDFNVLSFHDEQYVGCNDGNKECNDNIEIKDSDVEEDVQQNTRKENVDESNEDCTKIMEDTGANFNFTILFTECAKLPFVDKVSYKGLGGNWADVFSKPFNKVQPMCVLVFKYNRIARSHKATNYGWNNIKEYKLLRKQATRALNDLIMRYRSGSDC